MKPHAGISDQPTVPRLERISVTKYERHVAESPAGETRDERPRKSPIAVVKRISQEPNGDREPAQMKRR